MKLFSLAVRLQSPGWSTSIFIWSWVSFWKAANLNSVKRTKRVDILVVRSADGEVTLALDLGITCEGREGEHEAQQLV